MPSTNCHQKLPKTVPPHFPGSLLPTPSRQQTPLGHACWSVTAFLCIPPNEFPSSSPGYLQTKIHIEVRVISIKVKWHYVTFLIKTLQWPPIGLRKKKSNSNMTHCSATWSLLAFLAWFSSLSLLPPFLLVTPHVYFTEILNLASFHLRAFTHALPSACNKPTPLSTPSPENSYSNFQYQLIYHFL